MHTKYQNPPWSDLGESHQIHILNNDKEVKRNREKKVQTCFKNSVETYATSIKKKNEEVMAAKGTSALSYPSLQVTRRSACEPHLQAWFTLQSEEII